MGSPHDELTDLPFGEQVQRIDAAIAADDRLPELLEVLGALRDHEPLAHAVRALARASRLDDAPVTEAVHRLLLELPDTGVQRLLKGLDRHAVSEAQQAIIARGVARAMRRLPLDRLAALCLMDRWLKNADPDTRQALCDEAVAEVARAMRDDALHDLEDAVLLRVPGRELAGLEETARQIGLGEAWQLRRQSFAHEVLDLLEAMPKSLSQANAEELLSRRVYAHPGHFLVELLQNAEDALARAWHVEVGDEQVTVWHDGVVFDAKDVVGVLSIGQTTKRREQIGFFGVGFKSVYEICERPQIYSDVFCFEVADVSIPRRLGRRPAGARKDGTLLELPLRQPDDPLRSPEVLYERALAVPPQTLLTLTHLEELQVGRNGARRTARQEVADEPGRVRIVAVVDGPEPGRFAQEYLVEQDTFAYHAADREASRVGRTPVLVALGLDPQGRPQPLAEDTPTVFSYLPTQERSGLRFMLHAHFDLPIDRERLDLASPWNAWAIAQAGELLARTAARLAAEARENSAQAKERLVALLDVVPLRQELTHPSFERIVERLREQTRDLALLCGAAGELLTPTQAAVLCDDRLLGCLAGVALDLDERRALARLSPRAREVARDLGAALFDVGSLVTLLESTLAGPPGEPPPTAWLADGLQTLLTVLAESEAPIDRLEPLSLLPDQQGRLWPAASLARAPEDLRAIYGEARPLIHEDLEDPDPPALARLLDELGLLTLDAGDLMHDLHDADRARRILSPGVEPALTYLRRQPVDATPLLQLPLFPDERGVPRPLLGEATSVWLAPEGPLGAWLRGMAGERPPLLDTALGSEFGPWLRRLGAQTLDLPAVLAALAEERLTPTREDVAALHRVLDSMHADLTPRVCAELRRASIFPDRRGRLRPLTGNGRALLPADEHVVQVAPRAPWVHDEIAGLSYLRGLGAKVVGPDAVVRVLLLEEQPGEESLFDPGDPEDLRRVYSYLIQHHEGLDPRLLRRLSDSPIWLDVTGTARSLDELRQPSEHDALAALYAAWASHPIIDDTENGAADLAAALQLHRLLLRPGFDQLICDLIQSAPEDLVRVVEPGGDLRPLLLAALAETPRAVSQRQLRRLREAPLFRTEAGRLLPLGDWIELHDEVAPEQDRCYRADGPLREALQSGSRPLLCTEDDEALEPVLSHLQVDPAGVTDLVRAVETDPLLTEPSAATRVRAALTTLRDELARALPSDVGLERLPIWPTLGSTCRPASEVIRGTSLAEMLGPDWQQLLDEEAAGSLLDPAAEGDADALEGLVVFRPPTEFLVEQLREAREGEPLDEQPAFLQSREQLIQITSVLLRDLETEAVLRLPVMLHATGRLARGQLLQATPDEIALAAGLDLAQRLADPQWAAEVVQLDPELAPRLSARRLIAELLEVSREIQPLEDHPLLDEPTRRALLYGWLLERCSEIATDDQARGPLAHACVVADQGGQLRSPNKLLLESELSDDFGHWTPADEVPEPLIVWLRQTFGLDEGQLDQLVAYLMEAHETAARDQDGARSARLLGHLVGVLRLPADPAEAAARLPRRFRLHRLLRVEADDGHFARPRTLLAVVPEEWDLISACCVEPPSRVSPRYEDPRVRALIHAAGAKVRLTDAQILALVDAGEGLRKGPQASLALARYVVRLATREPELRHTLRLDRRAFIPDGRGGLQPPDALYWPDPEVVAVVGEDPARYPHPEFFLTAPEEVRQWLKFRTLDEARLADVAAEIQRVAARGHVPGELFGWLEEGLRKRRLKPAEVRQVLGEVVFILDDDSVLRPPRELLRHDERELFGDRRGTWSGFSEHRRLADALAIPERAGRREVVAYLEEVALDAREAGMEELLNEEPELLQHLPRCLALLTILEADPPEPLLLAAADLSRPRGRQATLCWLTDPDLCLPEPESLAWAAREAGAPVREPLLSGDADEEVLESLAAWGVRPCSSRFTPDDWPKRLDHDITERHADEAAALEAAMAALFERAHRLRDAFPELALDRWLDPPKEHLAVRVVAELVCHGELAGTKLRFAACCALDRERHRLLTTPAGLADRSEVAEVLCRETIWDGPVSLALLERVTRELERAPKEEVAPEAQKPKPRKARKAAAPPVPVAPAAPEPEPPPEPAAEEEDRDRAGLMTRLRRWLRGDDEPDRTEPEKKEPEREKSAPPPERSRRRRARPDRPRRRPQVDEDNEAAAPGAPEHGRWFRPRSSVRPQLRANPDWLADREQAPTFGFAFSPRRLPLPYLYGPQLLADRFDSRHQRWVPAAADPTWRHPGGGGEARIAFRGRLPAGEVSLPLPLYGRLTGLEVEGEHRLLETPDGPMLALDQETELTYEVTLDPAPDFVTDREVDDVPAHLLAATTPDEDLPAEVLDFLDGLNGDKLSPLQRTVECRAFVQASYRYDPSYLEDPTVARFLRSVSQGRANSHIAALHAGRDAHHLGRGVCYELNVLTCELLRRTGVPAAVATGWTFDRGSVTEPDHLWAMALLPSDLGPRWLPVDASTTREGRPLHAAQRQAGPWRVRAPKRKGDLPSTPKWAASRSKRQRGPSLPLSDLLRVAHHLEELTGQPAADDALLRQRCRDLLADPDKARLLLDLLRPPDPKG